MNRFWTISRLQRLIAYSRTYAVLSSRILKTSGHAIKFPKMVPVRFQSYDSSQMNKVVIVLGSMILLNVDYDEDYKSKKLFKAVKRASVTEVERLVNDGADPDARHRLGWTALHVATGNSYS